MKTRNLIFPKLVIILFCLFAFQKGYSQNSNLINVDQNLKILEIYDTNYSYVRPYIFKDYDNKDNIWIQNYYNNLVHLYRVNVDFDTLEYFQIDNEIYMCFKYDNKLFTLNQYENNLNLDSLYLSVYDSVTNHLYSKKIIDNTDSNNRFWNDNYHNPYWITLTDDRNLLFYQIDNFSLSDSVFIDIHLFDLLGNPIKNNLISFSTQGISGFSNFRFVETQDNYKIFSHFFFENKVLNFDKSDLSLQSIDILDGIDLRNSLNGARRVNDSIVVSYGNSENSNRLKANIINYKTNKVNSIYFGDFNPDSLWVFLYNPIIFSDLIDFSREDSIYFCYKSSEFNENGVQYSNPGKDFLTIVNFNINGDLNFTYKIDYDSVHWINVTGIKVIGDNNLLITGILYGKSWILKFSPNGFASLTNLDTNEKASIKVYPNPSNDFINVDIEADRFSSSEIELFDIQGRLVKKSKLNAQIGNRIDVSNLSSGAYTYRVVINGKGISGKVIIGE